jgi:hypothetical protein
MTDPHDIKHNGIYNITEVPLPSIYSPFERILLTANGNLQRIMMAYYNQPVHLRIIYNQVTAAAADHSLHSSPPLYKLKRQVELYVQKDKDSHVFCTATSDIDIFHKKYLDALVHQGMGVGQLLRTINIYPEFTLKNMGRNDIGLWREYTLTCPQAIHCLIHEQFHTF